MYNYIGHITFAIFNFQNLNINSAILRIKGVIYCGKMSLKTKCISKWDPRLF